MIQAISSHSGLNYFFQNYNQVIENPENTCSVNISNRNNKISKILKEIELESENNNKPETSQYNSKDSYNSKIDKKDKVIAKHIKKNTKVKNYNTYNIINSIKNGISNIIEVAKVDSLKLKTKVFEYKSLLFPITFPDSETIRQDLRKSFSKRVKLEYEIGILNNEKYIGNLLSSKIKNENDRAENMDHLSLSNTGKHVDSIDNIEIRSLENICN